MCYKGKEGDKVVAWVVGNVCIFVLLISKRIEFVYRTGVDKQWSLLLVLDKVEEGMMGFRKNTWPSFFEIGRKEEKEV